MSPKTFKCPKCSKTPNDKKLSVSCDSCKSILYGDYHRMSPTEVRVFELKTISRVVSFLCVDCKSLMAQTPNIMKQLEEIWSPYFKKDIELLEKVQLRFTKVPRALKNIPYEERLKNKLKLTTLKDRRERGDMIETYKITHGHYDLENFYKDLFQYSKNTYLRGHHFKLTKAMSNNNSHKHFFSQRVVEARNKLPSEVISAQTINQFKNRLDKQIK